MFVTTAGRTNKQMIEKAISIANDLEISFLMRNKMSVDFLQTKEQDDCIVVGKNRLEIFLREQAEPFFFHPNSATFRIKRLMKGEHDPFVEAAKLRKGMTVLDCTMGLAADSIVASFVVGSTGKVIGTEANKYIAYLVRDGLNNWASDLAEMNMAMRRIQVFPTHSYDFLGTLQSNSFDIVYFDPMFEETIMESDGIKALGRFAVHDDLTMPLILEAIRVAKCRVILKDHFRSSRFERFGFNQIRRKSAKFHFGVLEKRESSSF